MHIFCNLAHAKPENRISMNNAHSLAQLQFDVWLIEQLQMAPSPGLSLVELERRWLATPGRSGGLSRDRLTTHRQNIGKLFGIKIMSPDRKHYRIMNPESLRLDSLANDLLKSIQNYAFLQEYKDLGSLIQPEQIETGSRYLQQIGQALRNRQKLRVTYQKFTDVAPYDAILHPYCLKADKGRWYILAHKEGSEHQEPAQCFALDRTLRLSLLPDTFRPNPAIDPDTYFHDCFGVWHDYDTYPVRDITIECTENVAHYLRTLPLHHSQKELRGKGDGIIHFHYHISPSPDFFGELSKWGEELWIEDNEENKKASPKRGNRNSSFGI